MLRQGSSRRKDLHLPLSIPWQCLLLDEPQGKPKAGSLDDDFCKAQLPLGYRDQGRERQNGGRGGAENNPTTPQRPTGLVILRHVQAAKHVQISLVLTQ